jgi:hypothetical protein
MDFDGGGRRGCLMAVASFNCGGNGQRRGGGAKKRLNNQIEATAAAGGKISIGRSTAEMDYGV